MNLQVVSCCDSACRFASAPMCSNFLKRLCFQCLYNGLGTGAPETIVKALEAETLQKIAAHGGASEAASAIAARYNLEIHEKSEAAAFKTASDLVGVAKTPRSEE